MECTFGFIGADYVLLASDTSAIRSIVKFKNDEDKVIALNQKTLVATMGENGDRVQFFEFISKNLKLTQLRLGYEPSIESAAYYTRSELATSLRKHPYHTDLIIGGYDKNGPSLYYLDYLAALAPVNFTSHGYGSHFLLSILDKYWKPSLSFEHGMNMVKQCLFELKTRFIINIDQFQIKIVKNDGIHIIDVAKYMK